MAIYHLSAKIINRQQGRSAVAAAAYRAATVLKDYRLGQEFDYSKKRGCEHSEIIAPKNAPSWVYDRETLWNEIEKSETRINSQLAREVEVALPVELTKSQSIALIRDFINREFITQGMVADINLHMDNPENPHAHIMLTTREIGESGFTKKNRSWNDKAKLFEWRKSWAELANEHLREAGITTTIDHRSYAEQGIGLTPNKHLGNVLARELANGEIAAYERLEDYQAVVTENFQRIIENPKIALAALTSQQAVFSDIEIGKLANRNSLNQEQYDQIIDQIKSNIIAIGTDERGRLQYTTHEMLELENSLINSAVTLNNKPHHSITEQYYNQALTLTPFKLNAEQQATLEHILTPGDLKVVIGFAGTGKSSLMSIAKNAWEGQGYRVLGAALSGIAAQNLQETGITSRTIDSLLLALKNQREKLNQNDILVIDEAGMINTHRLAEILYQAELAQTKVILLGDPEQLQPIQAGAPFKAIAERVGYMELNEIVRQYDQYSPERTALMREATKEFATQKTTEALTRYENMHSLFWRQTRQEAREAMIKLWNVDRNAFVGTQSQIMLAYTRKDVAVLNEQARELLKADNLLGKEHQLTVKTRDGIEQTKGFAANDRIYFLMNDSQLGVKNGSLGTIEGIYNDDLVVKLDTGKSIAFNLKEYPYLDHGYATTIHKSQGITVDRTYLLADKYLDRHATYVGCSRHRTFLGIYCDKETFTDRQQLFATLSCSTE
jgi:Ti-type conjugative transfer relaxase TraA